MPEYGTRSVAQFVFALLLELCHRAGRHDLAVHQGEWARRGDFSFWDGRRWSWPERPWPWWDSGASADASASWPTPSAWRSWPWTRTRAPGPPIAPFAWASLEQACARADVLSLNCALTEENRGLVDAALLARMKPSAFLINAARGPLVDEPALAAALNAGTLAGAALDVVWEEPIRADNPLLSARNCLLTPHIAWATLEARRRLMHEAAENLRAFLAGDARNRVN